MLLSDICEIIMGQSPSSDSYNVKGQGLPFFQGNADFGKLYPSVRLWCNCPIKKAEAGDLLVSVRAPIGAVNLANQKCCIGRGLAALRPYRDKCDAMYLYYLIKAGKNKLNWLGTGSTFKAITRSSLLSFNVPDYCIALQRKISSKLWSVDKLIHQRNEQLKLFDLLIQSRFLELFGDLKLNSKNWKIFSFPEFALIDTQMIHDFHNYEDYPHIGIDSIEKDTGNILAYRTIGEDHVISGKYLFTANHIVYSKIRPNLNKVALPDFDGLCSADAYPILPIEGKSNRYFLAFILRSNLFLSYILAFSNRTNLPKVNKAQIERFRCPLPPIEMQDRFAIFYKQVDKSKYGVTIFLHLLEDIRICCNI